MKSIEKSQKPTLPTQDYTSTLAELKQQIHETQIKAAVHANKELTHLYWTIGKIIAEKQKKSGWGTKVIEKLANDLQGYFPSIKGGFSKRNLFRMRAFYQAYEKVPQAVAQLTDLPVFSLPWGHNTLILEKVKNTKARLWYAAKTIENGWSRSMLIIWIENDLYNREGKAITNFKSTLPAVQSDLAQQATKDPYLFDFLCLDEKFRESELEQSLIDHIQKLLMEFGRGFAFVGRQCELIIDGDEFFVDLLFYHTVLHCYVVVELKTGKFKPEFAGKMNFYLGAVDRLFKKENDNPSIGLILCKSKSQLQVEVSLQGISKPIGVADYLVAIDKGVPKEFVSSLPTIEEIEAELSGELEL
jgi:predicted nuclease of restriction endonuclease-like (RecB) superfamily